MIVLFEPWHMRDIIPQEYQINCDRSQFTADVLAGVGAFTCLDNGVPIALGGIVPAEKCGLIFDTGIGQAWMLIGQDITHKWPEIFRATRRELYRGLRIYHRIEATTGFDAGERFLSMLGMQWEGRLKKGNAQGRDASLWSLTR